MGKWLTSKIMRVRPGPGAGQSMSITNLRLQGTIPDILVVFSRARVGAQCVCHKLDAARKQTHTGDGQTPVFPIPLLQTTVSS
jgi:hypothetical protein